MAALVVSINGYGGTRVACYVRYSMPQELHVPSKEELRVHTETDVERVGTRADADTERLAEEDPESVEERRRSAYRLT